jgi:tRNA dimethylallyltransferase
VRGVAEKDSELPLVVVVGPTASGKTALAVRAAEALDGEIVSADSVQIYRRFDVGAGKPTAEELRRARHHLVDAIEPLEPMDAARWAELADAAIADIRARGKRPIVCGGTFLWVRALVYGLAPAPPADETIRARHQALALEQGRAALHARLALVDAAAAERLSPNDLVRVSRALEVFELTGTPQSAWHAEHGFRTARYAAGFFGIRLSPEELSLRIERRASAMFDAGWTDEVRGLLRDGFRDARAMTSVGYRQVAEAVEAGPIDRAALLASVVRATRIFARRQRTWLNHERIEWLEPADAETFSGLP